MSLLYSSTFVTTEGGCSSVSDGVSVEYDRREFPSVLESGK